MEKNISLSTTYQSIVATGAIAVFFYFQGVTKLISDRGVDISAGFAIVPKAELVGSGVFFGFTLINIVYVLRVQYKIRIKKDLLDTQFDVYFRNAVLLLVFVGTIISFVALGYFATTL